MSRRVSRRKRGQAEVNAKIGSLLERIEGKLTMSDEEFEQLLVEFDLLRYEPSVRARIYNDGWMSYPRDGAEVWRKDNVSSLV